MELGGEGELGFGAGSSPSRFVTGLISQAIRGQFCRALVFRSGRMFRLRYSAFARLSDGKFIGVLLQASLGELLAIVGDGVGQQVTASPTPTGPVSVQQLGESNYQPKDRASQGCRRPRRPR